jgi:3',5'-cyclic AMP phosphodiesterase CpdA
MATYDAVRGYDPELTVRDYGELLQRLRKPPPDGALWLVLAPRRYGKTWTLKELRHRLGGAAHYLDLRDPEHQQEWSSRTPAQPGEYWLLDEPMSMLKPAAKRKSGQKREARDIPDSERLESARAFLTRCAALHKAGAVVILALTPRELHLLREADDGSGRVSLKSLVRLPPLTPERAWRQARTPGAQTLLRVLPEIWTRSPFFLELLFQLDERQRREMHTFDSRFLSSVLTECDSANHHYFDFVFWDALADEDRTVLRQIATGKDVDRRVCQMLANAGLVEVLDQATEHYRLADPVLAAYLSPVRIHHISDIHVGPKSAQSIDAKEAGFLADAMDPGTVREGYLSHLEALRTRGEGPHLVIISGDLTEWATQEQFQEARRWVDRLAELLDSHVLLDADMRRVLLVGGNHDVDWSQAREDNKQARHQRFATMLEGYEHPHLEKPPEARSRVSVAWPDAGLEILLLGSSEFGGQVDEDQERHQLQREMAKLPRDPSKQDKDKAEELALQAARMDPGLVHTRDLDRVNAQDWRHPVSIAVLHHPLSPLPSTEVGRYAGLLNAGAVKQVLMAKGFCLVLCGHAHSGLFAEEHWPGRESGVLRIAAAPSLGSREIAENNGFNVVEIFRDRDRQGQRTHKVLVRRFVRQGERNWVEHAERMGPFVPCT